jgi:hypothetical protein
VIASDRDSYMKAYSSLFMGFVVANKLDLDPKYWPKALEVEWKTLFDEFQTEWGREPLL